MGDLKTSIIIDVINKATEPVRKIQKTFSNLRRTAGPALDDVGKNFSALTNNIGMLAAKLTILGTAGAWAFKSQFIDTAASFEQFTAVLEAVEGSSSKAKKSMGWVSDFATKTPYELSEVTDAFVKLRAYGLNPMDGLLTDLGDASSAMGKPLMQAVEAIADAVTGENERLKEFGIKAATKGKKTRFAYTDSQGNQQYKIVDNTNRAIIESTLRAIWNEKYSGAMDKQSRTWRGMVSNISDQWTRFKIKVMDAGLFDWMKTKLAELLEITDKMSADGSLQRIAELWGNNIKSGMEKAWIAGQILWRGFVKIRDALDKVADAIGGYDKLLIAVGITMATKTVIQVVSLGASLVKLGTVVVPALGSAFTAMAAISTTAITTLTGAVSSLYATLLPVLKGLAVITAPAVAAGVLAKGSHMAGKAIGEHQISVSSTQTLKNMLAREGVTGLGPDSPMSRQIRDELDRRARAGYVPTTLFAGHFGSGSQPRNIGNNDRQFSGELRISIDSEKPVKVDRLRSSHGFDIDVDSGRMMVSH